MEKRRGYTRARDRKRAAESGLDDLPVAVAVAIEQSLGAPAATPEPPQPADATVEELVTRLEAIKDRIFRLRAVFAVTLSQDCAMEANRYLALFQTTATQLEEKDPDSLANITRGFESLLLSPPIQMKGTIPLETQRLVEQRWEISQSPRRRPPMQADTIGDGLGWLL
jgi:hypothetical protein